MTAPDVEVRHVPEHTRYELWAGGTRLGLAEYVVRGDRDLFTHTEIDPSVGGRGLGGVLVRRALDAERAAGRRIVPLCPFVAAYVDKHPDYADLVDRALVERIDRPD